MTIGLGINHSIKLVIDAVEQPVRIECARNAEFLVGMAAHTGLKENEVVRIAGRQRQVFRLSLRNCTANIRGARLYQRRATGNFDCGLYTCGLQRSINHSIGSSLKHNIVDTQRGKSRFLYLGFVNAERKVGNHVVTLFICLHASRVCRFRISNSYVGAYNRSAGCIGCPTTNGTVNRLRLGRRISRE